MLLIWGMLEVEVKVTHPNSIDVTLDHLSQMHIPARLKNL